MKNGEFQGLDWVVFAAYVLAIFLVGAWFARRQTSTSEFFVASRRMHWLPVSMSIAATLLSGISFIGHPARVFRYDSVLVAWPLAAVLTAPVVIYALLPFYRRLHVTTAYEYLEHRFGLNVRLLASALFISKRLIWMALVALAPSLALSTVTGIRVEYCIAIIGVVATLYTGLGGMSAVIWTDMVQFIVLTLGQVLIVGCVVAKVDGGLSEVWRTSFEHHKAWMSMQFDLGRLTFWTTLIAGFAFILSDFGADQVTVQRLMSARTDADARKSVWMGALLKFPTMILLIAAGVALWVFYYVHPALLELEPKEYDKIVPFFVVTQFPPGVSGLVVAAIFAAAMSSFDSGLNCLVATLTVDWYERVIRPSGADRRYLRLAQGLTYVLGLAVTILAIAAYLTGIQSIIDASNKYLGFFGGALLGVFLLGTLTRRASSLPTVLGAIVSVAAIIALDRWQTVAAGYLLHPYLYGFLTCVVTMLLGYVGSVFLPARWIDVPRRTPGNG
jgi:SSS family solute:Na+ symporter